MPIVGCPAIGSSSPGVKIRTRTSVSARSAGSTNVVSEKFISLAIACIVAGARPRAVEEHRELIAAEEVVGEDVEMQIPV